MPEIGTTFIPARCLQWSGSRPCTSTPPIAAVPWRPRHATSLRFVASPPCRLWETQGFRRVRRYRPNTYPDKSYNENILRTRHVLLSTFIAKYFRNSAHRHVKLKWSAMNGASGDPTTEVHMADVWVLLIMECLKVTRTGSALWNR